MPVRTRSPEAVAHRQRRALARYLRFEVAPYSSYYGPRLRQAQLHQGRLASLGDLRRLPLTTWDEVANGSDFVLRPDRQTVLARGLLRHRWAAAAGVALRRPDVANRLVFEPAYKPVQWHREGAVAVGSSADDLARLGELGRRWLETAGAHPSDVVVSLLHPDELGFWQLSLGARSAGITAVALEPDVAPAEVAALEPSVVAGSIPTLVRLLDDPAASERLARSLRVVLVVGGVVLDGLRRRLAERAGGASVVAAWAPPGVRALWSECRGNHAFHTWPEFEYVEVTEPDGSPAPAGDVGEIVWTGIGWRGTALLRLATGAFAVADGSPCPACAHDGLRLWRVAPEPVVFDALDDHDEVVDWCADRRQELDGRLRYDVVLALRDGRRRSRVLDGLAAVAAEEPEFVVTFETVTPKAMTAALADRAGAQVLDADGAPAPPG